MDETSNSGGAVVAVQELGPGWVYIHVIEGRPDPAQASRLLDDALWRWCRERPHCRVRAALPIQVQGHTRAIHLWWDEVPEAAAVPRQTSRGG